MNVLAGIRATGASLWLAVFACGWFVAATLYAALHIELGFDPAYHASVAKNFATGHGWASSYDRAFPFNPDVTTGPAMLLPAAAMIALFGNAIWVPGVTAALLHLLLYALVLLSLKRCFDEPRHFHICVVALSLVFTHFAHVWWLSLTADFLVCLSLLLACLLLTVPVRERPLQRWLCAGLVLGYALLAKALAWFGLAGLLLYALLCRRRWPQRAASARSLAALVLGACMLLLPWQLYQAVSLSALDPAQRAERAEYRRDFFVQQGSGLQEIAAAPSLPRLLGENLHRNGSLLADHLRMRHGLPAGITALLVLALLGYTAWRVRRSDTPLQRLHLALGLIASLQLTWYLLLSASWNAKYTLAPVILGLVMLCTGLAQQRRAGWLIALLLVSLPWVPGTTRSYVSTFASFGAQDSEYTRDMLSTRDYLLQRQSTLPLAGCGWVFAPWEFEFLLPGSGHFRDCRSLIAEGLRSDAPEGAGGPGMPRYAWVRAVEFDLVVNHVFWNASPYASQYEPVLRACLPQTLHRTRYFSVARCSAEGLQRHIVLDRPSELLPLQPPRQYIHKPLPIR